MYKNISFEEAKRLIDNNDAIVLDVRTKMEFVTGHIENSISIPVDLIRNKAKNILNDNSKNIIVYCLSGGRSANASQQLIEMGFNNVYNLGAISNWKEKLKIGIK